MNIHREVSARPNFISAEHMVRLKPPFFFRPFRSFSDASGVTDEILDHTFEGFFLANQTVS